MKRIKLIMSLVLTLVLGGVGFSTSSVYAAPTTTAQAQPLIEHMQKLIIDPTTGMVETTFEEWYDPVTGSKRRDEHSLSLDPLSPFRRFITQEGTSYVIT